VLAGVCIILGAVYILAMIRKVAYGNVNELTAGVVDIKLNEKWALGIIVVLILFFGIYPQPMLNLTSDLTNSLVNKFEVLRHVVPK
jgi:NADH-quinone oxidoreductase subunit M